MKVKLALLVVAWQVLVLAFMAGQREWIQRTGTPLTLRTAPVDPNDPMRGAYVRLDYEISFVPATLCWGEVAKWTKTTDYREQQRLCDRVVYAALHIDAYGLANLTSLSETPPDTGPYLRGRVVSADSNGVRVRYGIEALFMHKAAAQKMEAMARNEKAGAPMAISIGVGPSGIAVLKDHAWEPLGITITPDRPPQPQNRSSNQQWQQRVLTGLTVTLHNYGDKDVAIVNLPDGQSFHLLQNYRVNMFRYEWVGREENCPLPTAADIIVLKPGATHQVHLDLTQPQWWVIDTNKPEAGPMPLQKVTDAWSASFRIQYAPPPATATRDLPHADLIRHAPLRSRAFNANAGVD